MAPPSVEYDGHALTIDGVRISPELIRDALCRPGRRRHVIFEPDGTVRYLSSEPMGDTVVYVQHVAPSADWW